MKFFRKKNARQTKPSSRTAQSNSEQSFYSQHVGETPLDEYSAGPVGYQTHRTSRHSPARRRESSNRASSWAIALLLLRTGLIIALLVGGFVVLKLVLERAAKPTEKQQQKWEANATRLDSGAASVA